MGHSPPPLLVLSRAKLPDCLPGDYGDRGRFNNAICVERSVSWLSPCECVCEAGENEAIDARLQRGAFAAREDAVGMNRTGPDAHPERVMSHERSSDKLRELGGKSELRGGAVCR